MPDHQKTVGIHARVTQLLSKLLRKHKRERIDHVYVLCVFRQDSLSGQGKIVGTNMYPGWVANLDKTEIIHFLRGPT